MSILFLQGVNDNGLGRLGVARNGNTNLVMDGSCNVSGMLNFQGATIHRIVFFGESAEQDAFHLRKQPSLIFNEISDPDTHQVALQRAEQFCRDAGVPVINAPDRVQQTTRDQVAQLLQGIPRVQMPRTIRFQAEAPGEVFEIAKSASVGLPAIMRIAGDHGGISMVLLSDKNDIDKLHVFPFGNTIFYLTEFVDYRDSNGFYHKQRIVVVDGEPIARHAFLGQYWNVHGSSHSKEAAQPEDETIIERTLLLRDQLIPKVMSAINEIANRLELDYFGIDCYINQDGEMLIFEVNANMNMLVGKLPGLNSHTDMIRDKLCAMLTSRSGEDVSWTVDPQT